MKYMFINKNGNQQSVEIPQEYIDRTMRSLGCDKHEACELYLSDEGYIENAEAVELNAKATKKKRKAPQRKEDPIKRALISYLLDCIDGKALPTKDGMYVCDDAVITNPERIVQFKIDDDTYELTLSRKRKPKA